MSLREKLKDSSNNWWRGASIYQIYPRSFYDSNNDGIGDIKGIIQKLNYLEDLGIDAIWISPFFTSPMKDFGYDVSNYKSVDKIFGTTKDFKNLIDKAAKKNIRVIIDQVLSHTSDEHEWFKESKKDKTNIKSDWYVWADAKKDGSPPNNWLSIFGGSSWQWDTNREQYYLHNFLKSQPDLNFHNKEVQDALLDVLKFWLDLGVDGFRFDTVNFYFHNQNLKSNPASKSIGNEVTSVNPYAFQSHLYDKSQPENVDFLIRMRKLFDKYDGITSVGEIGDAHKSLELMKEYTSDNDKLHMCYTFDFLGPNFTPKHFKTTIEKFETMVRDGWACWSFSNHDVIRHISRFDNTDRQSSTLCLALLCSLKGSICLYQGEELGFEESDVKFKDLTDPYGKEFWPKFKGRDGCRTPIAWMDDKKNGGFSNSDKTWLPVDKKHIKMAANTQIKNPNSTFTSYKNILNFRKNQQLLRLGDIRVEIKNDILKIIRFNKNDELICLFNLSRDKKMIKEDGKILLSKNIKRKKGELIFSAFSFCFLKH